MGFCIFVFLITFVIYMEGKNKIKKILDEVEE